MSHRCLWVGSLSCRIFRDALLAGYQANRDVDVTQLDDFIALRQIAFEARMTWALAMVRAVYLAPSTIAAPGQRALALAS